MRDFFLPSGALKLGWPEMKSCNVCKNCAFSLLKKCNFSYILGTFEERGNCIHIFLLIARNRSTWQSPEVLSGLTRNYWSKSGIFAFSDLSPAVTTLSSLLTNMFNFLLLLRSKFFGFFLFWRHFFNQIEHRSFFAVCLANIDAVSLELFLLETEPFFSWIKIFIWKWFI